MPRPSGAFDESPIVLVGWPADIADQILRDEIAEERTREPYVPISISSLAANRRTVHVDFGGETLTLSYRPSSVNAVQEARELEERGAGKHVESVAVSLAEIIESWDLVDDKGKPAPVSVELLRTLGLDTLQKLTREIITDLLPNRTTAPSSNGTSLQTADSAPSPSGT